MKEDPFLTPVGRLVKDVFSSDPSNLRSVGGIARQAGLSPDQVTRFIDEYEECFEESSVKLGGTSLYKIHPRLHSRFPDKASAAG